MAEQHRDKSVERWLRQTPAAGARSESACLDAEALAAWAEGLLNGPERTAAEAHASGCARCQAMLAVMVRTMPGPPPRTASPLRKWLMMLSPAMAAAAAVALWFAVDQRPLPPPVDSLSRGQEVARVPAEAAKSSAASPATVTEAVPEQDARSRALGGSLDQTLRKRDAPQSELQASKPLADAFKEREERAGADKKIASAEYARAKPLNERKDEGLAARPLAAPAPPPPPPAKPAAAAADSAQSAAADRFARVVPQQQTAQNQSQNQNQSPNQNQNQNQNQVAPRPQAGAPVAEQVVVTSESPAVVADKIAAGRAAARKDGPSGSAGAAIAGFRSNVATFDVVAPDASARWRVVDGRTVQRSLDAGATWANHYSAEDGVMLTAGAAPTSTVCWLVGRGGVIVLTTDGRDWQRVKFPEPVDLTAVTSTDARTATVTTANGRRFLTTDGGRNWAPR
jgi:hypothetical protein